MDEPTDQEDNLIPNLAVDLDIANLPEISGEVQAQYEKNIQLGCGMENLNCTWNSNFQVTGILEF